MQRDYSAGAVVVSRRDGVWHAALIQPGGKSAVWALPKGNVEPGEATSEAAVREVREETGLVAEPIAKLGDVRYSYTWDGERVNKVVSVFLMRAVEGTLGELDVEHAHEVAATRWVPLADAAVVLTYSGEREMAERAQALLASHEGHPAAQGDAVDSVDPGL